YRGVAVATAQPGQRLVRRRVRLVGQFLDRAEDEVLEIHEHGDLREPVRLHRPSPSADLAIRQFGDLSIRRPGDETLSQRRPGNAGRPEVTATRARRKHSGTTRTGPSVAGRTGTGLPVRQNALDPGFHGVPARPAQAAST